MQSSFNYLLPQSWSTIALLILAALPTILTIAIIAHQLMGTACTTTIQTVAPQVVSAILGTTVITAATHAYITRLTAQVISLALFLIIIAITAHHLGAALKILPAAILILIAVLGTTAAVAPLHALLTLLTALTFHAFLHIIPATIAPHPALVFTHRLYVHHHQILLYMASTGF